MSVASYSPAPASKRLLRAVVPLAVRKRLAVAIQRQSWVQPARRSWWTVELVRDLAERDVDAFHRFLWEHHLFYAESYEASARFGSMNLKESRRMFFADLGALLKRVAPHPGEVRSVLEVGCSLGYQLRYLETELFPNAVELEGIDIDRYAIDSGSQHLREMGSKVRLRCADLEDLDHLIGSRCFDVIVCAGVLMYLNEVRAENAVSAMLRHADGVVAMAGLAHPEVDNATLGESATRRRDHTFVHNLDQMVRRAGGRILARRWEGSRDVDGNTIYFVFAARS